MALLTIMKDPCLVYVDANEIAIQTTCHALLQAWMIEAAVLTDHLTYSPGKKERIMLQAFSRICIAHTIHNDIILHYD